MLTKLNRKISASMETKIYMGFIALLSLLLCYFVVRYLHTLMIIPVIAVLACVYYYSNRQLINREIYVSSYLENIIRNIERTNHFAVRRLDIGIAVFSKEGKLQWHNEKFSEFLQKNKLEGKRPEEILPGNDNSYELLTVTDGSKEIMLGDRCYEMKFCRVLTQESKNFNHEHVNGLMLYLNDITAHKQLREKFINRSLCLALVRFDNYEDVTRGMSETRVANLIGEVNELLTKWVEEHHGFLCRMNKEICTVGFSYSALQELMNSKFTILDRIREIRNGNRLPPTISIGMACSADANTTLSMEELYKNANNALHLALTRGGDQAVVMQGSNPQFFGAVNMVNAKSTRVRARMVAHTIREQIDRAERIFVMGHTNEDYDAIGAAIGMAKLCLSRDKETYIVTSGSNENFDRVAEIMENDSMRLTPEDTSYMSMLVDEEHALKLMTPRSLLILVDHHRRVLSASKKVVDAANCRIIIDHHRRGEDIIDDKETLPYLEASSSSTCELVTELTAYFDDKQEFSPAEATVLYAGITLDTKNFAVQTGERTFEAAALLRRSGADLKAVRALFKDDLDSVLLRSRLIADAKMPVPGLAITIYRNAVKDAKSSVLIAQAADALITIVGIAVSMAIVEYKDGSLSISARSDGTVNVQLIMEELGGGGHQTMAAVQMANARAKDVESKIIELAKKQLEEHEHNESNSVTRC